MDGNWKPKFLNDPANQISKRADFVFETDISLMLLRNLFLHQDF